MSSYHLAQLNIAQLAFPLDSPELADFVANLDRINALAEQSPGFVWRMQTEAGDATDIDDFGADMIVNMSVWKDIQPLHDFVYRSAHVGIMRRRKEWFQKIQTYMVLWWVPAGHRPSLEEAEARLQCLTEHGPTERAFTFKQAFPAPDEVAHKTRESLDDTCPAT